MSLLLIPALSPSAQRSSWWAAYKSTIEDVLKRLRPSDEREIARLDIAVVLTPSFSASTRRTAFYPQFQHILREIYSLVCIAATQVKVELDFPGGIDARVFVLDSRLLDENSSLMGQQHFSGPIIDTNTFVGARRPYQTVFSVESEAGEGVLRNLLQLWREIGFDPNVERLSGGPSMSYTDNEDGSSSSGNSGTIHRHTINGGTFDHLHIGHKLLLTATVYMADPEPASSSSSSAKRSITIGITGDELLVNKKHASLVESWEERQQRTAEFVDSILVFHRDISSTRKVEETDLPGPNGKNVKVTYGDEVEINYTRISDPYGPTITVEALDALIVSAETRAGGKACNDKRAEKGWHPLEVFEVDVLDAEVNEEFQGTATADQTFGNKISSTGIRKRLDAKARSSNGHL